MLVSGAHINDRYATGLGYLAAASYDRFAKDLYGLNYRRTETPEKILLLLHAIDAWKNQEGASNPYSIEQLLRMLDNLMRLKQTGPSGGQVGLASGGGASSSVASLFILDSSSVNLSLSNGQLEAAVNLSSAAGNILQLKNDGLYVANIGSSGQSVLFVKNTQFATNNTYNNPFLAGKDIQIWHRGLGFLFYNRDDVNDPANEYSILETGGFVITIPNFNVNAGNNYFYIIINSIPTS